MVDNNISLDNITVLITGAAGFIGSSLIIRLFQDFKNIKIIGIDSLNDYYNISLKEKRLNKIYSVNTDWTFIKANIAEKSIINDVFEKYKPSVVVHLAAQAGVRYSITNPGAYIESNIVGFFNIIDLCKEHKIKHFIFASSSSVYGNNRKIPFSENDNTEQPVSLYAATKKSDELIAHVYSKIYGLPCTGLRFFTVYGPAGRPDMAYFSFTDKLLKGKTIQIFNYGNCQRDFTYIDDIVDGIIRVVQHAPEPTTNSDVATMPPYKIYNIGKGSPESLSDFIKILFDELVSSGIIPNDFDFQTHIKLVPMQAGDVAITYADTSDLEKDFNFKPSTTLRDGIKKFIDWYKTEYISK